MFKTIAKCCLVWFSAYAVSYVASYGTMKLLADKLNLK